MSTTTKSVALKLRLKDADVVRRGLLSLGKEGEAALRRLEKSAAPASKGLLALDSAVTEARGSLDGFSERAGIVGQVLGTLGPGGKMTAVAVAGVLALSVAAKRAAAELAEIKTGAEIAGTSVEYFQEMTYAAANFRIGVDAVQDGLKELALRADEFAATGKGSAEESFKRLGYSIEDVRTNLSDLPHFLEDIATRMQDLDKAAQVRVADELFGGTAGERFVSMLSRGGTEIANLRKEARDVGAVVDSQVIYRAERMTVEFGLAADAVQKQLNAALMETAPILEGIAALLGKIAGAVQYLKDESGSAANARISSLQESLEMIASMRESIAGIPGSGALDEYLTWEMERKQGRLNDLLAEEQRIKEMLAADPMSQGQSRGLPVEDEAAAKRSAKTAQRIADLAREVEQLEALSAAYGQSAQAVETVQVAMAADAELRRVGVERMSAEGQKIIGLVSAQHDLEKAIKERQAAEQEGARLTESLRTPQEAYNNSLEQANKLLEQGVISRGTYDRALSQANHTLLESDKVYQTIKDTGASAFDSITSSLRSSMEQGKSLFAGFRDGAVSALWDIANTAMQLTLLNPLKNSLFGLTGAAALPTYTFATGGIMTDQGPVPLRAYAFGGIANSPQLALYGEAGPEAYVPLPDGRTIPVTLTSQGGGASPGVTVNVIDQRKAGTQDVQPTTRRGADGAMSIDLLISDAVVRDFTTGGPISSAFLRSFDVRRRGY